MISARTISGSAETYLLRVKMLAAEQKARFLVIDPVSTWSKSENPSTAYSVTERLSDWSKGEGITLVCTKLLDQMFSQDDGGSSLRISTLAGYLDHLSYVIQAGERNRGLSIIKSRGTAQSNQVRELILSDAGVTLADTYTADGEVLMGTMRWEKERRDRVAHDAAEAAGTLKSVQLDAEEASLEVQLKSLEAELSAKHLEKALSVRFAETRKGRIVARPQPDARVARGPMPTRDGSERVMSRRSQFKFLLYIAGDAQNSTQAAANLNALSKAQLPGRHHIEVVDVFREPKRALADGIFMTPTLIKLAPLPARRIVGSLSQIQPLMQALGLTTLVA